jgi:hypothetical protein
MLKKASIIMAGYLQLRQTSDFVELAGLAQVGAAEVLEATGEDGNFVKGAKVQHMDLVVLFAFFEDVLPTVVFGYLQAKKGGRESVLKNLLNLEDVLYRINSVPTSNIIKTFLSDMLIGMDHSPHCMGPYIENFGWWVGVMIESLNLYQTANSSTGTQKDAALQAELLGSYIQQIKATKFMKGTFPHKNDIKLERWEVTDALFADLPADQVSVAVTALKEMFLEANTDDPATLATTGGYVPTKLTGKPSARLLRNPKVRDAQFERWKKSTTVPVPTPRTPNVSSQPDSATMGHAVRMSSGLYNFDHTKVEGTAQEPFVLRWVFIA